MKKILFSLQLLIISFLIVLAACKKVESVPVFQNQGNIDKKGGIIKTSDGAQVEIPPNALSNPQQISITQMPSLININNSCKVYEMKPDGLVFKDSIIIQLPIDFSYLDQSKDEKNNDIRVLVFSNGSWSILPSKIDLANKIAQVKTVHFSSYAISSSSQFAKYFNVHKSIGNVKLQVPYYNQRSSLWCSYYSTSMITTYAGYNYKAHNFALLQNKPPSIGLKFSQFDQYDLLLNQMGIQTECASPPWASVNDLCGYIMTKLEAGFPVMIGSQTETHAFVVSGYDSNGFYVNDPSGAFLNDAIGNITGFGDCEMVLVSYDRFKNSLVKFWDYVLLGLPERTLVITSKGNATCYGPTINFEIGNSIFEINSAQNQFIASLELNGIYKPNGYNFTGINNTTISSFDGSDYFKISPIVSNIDQNNGLITKVHYKLDDQDITNISPFIINIPPGNSSYIVSEKKIQLEGLTKGKHSFKIELRSSNSSNLYDSWVFDFEINNAFIISLPSVITSTAFNITQNSAKVGGEVLSDGGAVVNEYGIYWGTSQNPETTGTKLQIGSGTGLFSTILQGLNPNTPYYVKAYAINSKGPAYGSQVSFTTLPSVNNPPNSPSNPSPSNGATGISTSPTLSWSCSDPENDPLTYDVYFGTGNNPTTPIGTNLTTESIQQVNLNAGVTYYWKVVAKDNQTNSTASPVWSFTILNTVPGSVADIDGNVYNTITIGTQVWMKENLKTSKFNDGLSISLVEIGAAWATLSTPGYCFYNNDAATYKTAYGALYNWYAVNTSKLCPSGWHVPSYNDWTTLTTFLGNESIAGGKLKEIGTTHWLSPNTGATNESGFTALPSGYRNPLGTFDYIGTIGYWWSSNDFNSVSARYRYLLYNNVNVQGTALYYSYGMSVRCLRDN